MGRSAGQASGDGLQLGAMLEMMAASSASVADKDRYQAITIVAGNSHTADEARQFIEMLGLDSEP